SRPTSAPSTRSPTGTATTRPRPSRCGARSTCRAPPSTRSTSGRWPPASDPSPTPATPRPARCARRPPASPPGAPPPRLPTQRPRALWAYQLGEVVGGPTCATPHETLEWLRSLGLPVNPEIRQVSTPDEVLEYCLHWQQHRHDLDYEIDGVVVKVDDLAH